MHVVCLCPLNFNLEREACGANDEAVGKKETGDGGITGGPPVTSTLCGETQKVVNLPRSLYFPSRCSVKFSIAYVLQS